MGQAHRRGANGSIYAYKTKAGTRYRFVFRDARGKQTSRNGYVTRAAARKARKRLMGKVHRGELRVSRESLGACWGRYLTQRRPYLEDGSWQDYRRHGELQDGGRGGPGRAEAASDHAATKGNAAAVMCAVHR